MSQWRGGRWRPALVALGVVLALLGDAGRAQETGWTPTGLTEATRRLYTPASGAFFALTRDRLLRSDNAGATWLPLDAPADPGQRGLRAAVDPTNHAVLYVGGANGLFRSDDGGATWTALSVPPPTQRAVAEAVEAIAVSPAEPRLVYLALTGTATISDHFRFLRSLDGGATWEALDEQNNTLCGWGVRALVPHPSDPRRVFRVASCLAGRNLNDSLWQSLDQGATWTRLFTPQNAFAHTLVGGAGALPGRYFLTANRDARAGGGARLYRSDDDAASWTEVAAWGGPNSPAGSGSASTRADGLAYHPDRPDQLWVALNQMPETPGAAAGPGDVVASADGGASWVELGSGDDLPSLTVLALGIDARNLYAASAQGVWRWPLAP